MSKEIIKSIQSLAAVKPFINLQALLNTSDNPILAAVLEFVDFGHHEYLQKVGPHPSGFTGWALNYKVPNGYGASVVRYQSLGGFIGSYGATDGLWQLAVLDASGNICYSTPVTDEVLGWLSPEDVNEALDVIERLPACHSGQDTTSSSFEEDFFIALTQILIYNIIAIMITFYVSMFVKIYTFSTK